MRRVWSLVFFLLPALAVAQVAVEETGPRNYNTSGLPIELTKPTVANGNFIVPYCFSGTDVDEDLDIDETGFANQVVNENSSGTDSTFVIETKVADGTEPSTLTCRTNAGSSGNSGGAVLELSGVDATTVYDVTAVDCGDASNTQTYPTTDCSITTVTDGALVCSFVTKEAAGNGVANPGSPWTVYAGVDDAAWVNNPKGGIACQVKVTAGSVTLSAGEWEVSSSGADWGGMLVAFRPAAAIGEFDTTPSVATQSDTAYTSITGSLDAAGDVHAVACPKDQTAPTVSQVQAADCTGDVNAAASDSASPSTGAFDFDLGLSGLTFPVYDVYVTDGTNLTTLADEALDVPTGENRCVLASVAGTSPFDGQGLAAGDYLEIVSLTDPDAYATFCENDATVGYAAGGDTSRQIIEADVYDISAETIDEYTLVYNNQPPELVEPDEWPLDLTLYEIGADPAYDSEVHVVDPEGDAITWAVTGGALPTDWTLNTTTGVLGISGAGACGSYSVEITATDFYSDTLALDADIDIGDLVPDVTGDALATAESSIQATCSMTTTSVDRCNNTQTAGNVASTSPAAGVLVGATTDVLIRVARPQMCFPLFYSGFHP